MEPYQISIIYYACVFSACEILRRLAFGVLGKEETLSRQLVVEFLGTLQVCACVFENGLVVKYYGVGGFFLAVTALVICHSFFNRGAIVTPCVTVERLLKGGSLGTALAAFAAQISGGYAAFRLAKLIWALHLSADHVSQYTGFMCSLNWRVPLWVFCVSEVLLSFVIRSVVGRSPLRSRRYVAAIVQATALSFELAVMGPPGLNPIIAFSRLYGCSGLGPWGHLLVYWASPMLGWLTAAHLHNPTTVETKKTQ